jgi:hypothetical protein
MVGRVGKDHKPFSGYDDIPAAADGDYPPWLQQRLDDVLPQSILDRFAEQKSSQVNGRYWHIDAAKADEVAEALRTLGFEVRRAGELSFF